MIEHILHMSLFLPVLLGALYLLRGVSLAYFTRSILLFVFISFFLFSTLHTFHVFSLSVEHGSAHPECCIPTQVAFGVFLGIMSPILLKMGLEITAFTTSTHSLLIFLTNKSPPFTL